jgi:hypothetical protein
MQTVSNFPAGQMFNVNKAKAIVYALSMLAFTTWSADDTNNTPPEFLNSHGVWSMETNGVRAGLIWDNYLHGQFASQVITVLVLTSKTNAVWDYVKPPTEKFAKFLLLDSNGGCLPPGGALNLFPDNPKILKEIHIQDACLIKTEGDYSLVVWPSIYQFSTNRQFVNRLDLMPLSMKLHLWPSQ